ncbi:MAG: CsgG/HfaB family protein [Candidatus Hydrogenedentota bacterium]
MQMLRAAAMLMAVLVVGCAAPERPEYTRGGEEYGVTEGVFRGRWWSYYERGVSYLAGGFHEEAAADFREALKGRARDSWRARTYGLHFVEYFPNRELGVALYHLGDLDEAESYLRQSLGNIDTERAHYFLDQVTKTRIAQGDIVDETAPEVTGQTPDRLLAERRVPIEVAAQDDVAVAEVRLNGRRLYQRGSTDSLVFADSLLFGEGSHAIEVTATDLADKATTERLDVTVDLTGPLVGIVTPETGLVTQAESITVEGIAADAHGVARVQVDGEPVAAGDGAARVPFSHTFPLAKGANQVVVKAVDMAGNETFVTVGVYRGDSDDTAALLWRLGQVNPRALKQANAGAAPLLVTLTATAEAEPGIHLKSPDPNRPYRHNRTLKVAGEVVAPGGVAALQINQSPLEPLTGAPRESFNRRIPIDLDADDAESTAIPVTITAQAKGGDIMEQSFEVEVRPVLLNSRESHMPVAVLAFAGNNVDTAEAERLRVTTEGRLINQDRFRVVDRTRLEDVLTEQQLSAALGDPNQAIELGRLTPAHVFLVADVFPRDAHGLEIKARLVSTETADLVATLDAFVDDQSDRTKIEEACAGLAEQFAALYPRLSGEVLSVRGDRLLINWTQEDGVREGAYMLVVAEEEPWIDEDTGEVLAPGDFIPVERARIENVRNSGVIAETVGHPEEDVELEKGMPAVTM